MCYALCNLFGGRFWSRSRYEQGVSWWSNRLSVDSNQKVCSSTAHWGVKTFLSKETGCKLVTRKACSNEQQDHSKNANNHEIAQQRRNEILYLHSHPDSTRKSNLDGVGKQLVQFRDLGCHAVIDCLLADFDHQTSEKIWVDLCGYLELLALAVLRL